jgi:F-type H+-transporting ATPase subunit b
MEETLNALGGLLLRAVPTLLLLVLLHYYLKLVFFRPLDKVLRERSALTEGARASAQTMLDAAGRQAAEYDAALREARGEMFREQEEVRRRWREEHHGAIIQARARAEAMVSRAREQLAEEAVRARESLRVEADALALRIADRILEGRAS